MMVDNIELNKTLKTFGLNEKEVEVYLTLVNFGWLTALQVSRKCPVKRTTLYRILESLLTKGLVEQKLDDKTTYYSVASMGHFENLVLEKERQAGEMRKMLPDLKLHFDFLSVAKPLEVSTKFYRGIRGLQHLELKAANETSGEILIIDSGQWHKVLTREFAEDVRSRIVKNNLMVREISNTTSPDTSWTDNAQYLQKHLLHREIPKTIIDIAQDIHVVGNTVQFSGYNQDDLVGIEIVSQEYAQMLKQMFEILWKIAKKP
jgi:sugar-specific transcriptional regulator TrmB